MLGAGVWKNKGSWDITRYNANTWSNNHFQSRFGQKNQKLATHEKFHRRHFCRELNFLPPLLENFFVASIFRPLGPFKDKKIKFRKGIARTAEWIVKMANVIILHDSLTRCEAIGVVRLSKFELEVFFSIF